MSRQVTAALINDLVILGGLIGNEIAKLFTSYLCESFGRTIFSFNDVGTMDVTLDDHVVKGFDLKLNSSGSITKDLGAVIVWRNPFTSDWRRAIMCLGFSTYGTADAARWAFGELIPASTQEWMRTFARYWKVRRSVRRKECCLFLLEFQYGSGSLQVPLGTPKLLYFGHFPDPMTARQQKLLRAK